MRVARRFPCLGLALVLAACTDGSDAGIPSGPDASLLGGTGLVACAPLPAESASVTIGLEGGAIQVGPHVLSVAPGALAGPVTITAILHSESVNRVELQPTGLTFRSAATLSLDYANCGELARLVPKRIVWVDDTSLEILEIIASLDNLFSHRVTARLTHFSSYAIAW